MRKQPLISMQFTLSVLQVHPLRELDLKLKKSGTLNIYFTFNSNVVKAFRLV